jgi:hypothetical protein
VAPRKGLRSNLKGYNPLRLALLCKRYSSERTSQNIPISQGQPSSSALLTPIICKVLSLLITEFLRNIKLWSIGHTPVETLCRMSKKLKNHQKIRKWLDFDASRANNFEAKSLEFTFVCKEKLTFLRSGLVQALIDSYELANQTSNKTMCDGLRSFDLRICRSQGCAKGRSALYS